jgi:hypothetical protein
MPLKHTPTYRPLCMFVILKQILEGTVIGSRGYTTGNGKFKMLRKLLSVFFAWRLPSDSIICLLFKVSEKR